jgi:hypothetical protein
MPAKITPQIAAHHEAGHAVVGLVLEIPIRYAMIKPRGKIRGQVGYGPNKSPVFGLIASLAGPQAQRRFAPRSDWFGGGDMVVVQKAIYGKRCKLTAKKKDSLLKFVAEHAMMFVDYFWADIKAVAKALLKRQRLTGEEVLHAIRAARRRAVVEVG